MLLASNIYAFTLQYLCFCNVLIIKLLQEDFCVTAFKRKNRTIFAFYIMERSLWNLKCKHTGHSLTKRKQEESIAASFLKDRFIRDCVVLYHIRDVFCLQIY